MVNYSDEMGIQILTDPDQIQVLPMYNAVIFQVATNFTWKGEN